MSTEITALKSQLRSAIDARRDSIVALRGRIWDLLSDIPAGVILRDTDNGIVCKITKVYSAAHQGPGWPVVGNSALGAVTPDGRTVAHDDLDRWDGHNWQRAFGPVMDRSDNPLPYLRAADTRKLALRLPAAITRYMEECKSERKANDTARESLTQGGANKDAEVCEVGND